MVLNQDYTYEIFDEGTSKEEKFVNYFDDRYDLTPAPQWINYSQGASRYGKMRAYGCRVVSVLKMLMEMNIVPRGSMDPDEFFDIGYRLGLFKLGVGEKGTYFGDSAITYAAKLGYTLEKYYAGGEEPYDETLPDDDIEAEKLILQRLDEGYFIMLHKKRHTVYVMREKSLESRKVYISNSVTGDVYVYNNGSYNLIHPYVKAHPDLNIDGMVMTSFRIKGTGPSTPVTPAPQPDPTPSNPEFIWKRTTVKNVTETSAVFSYYCDTRNVRKSDITEIGLQIDGETKHVEKNPGLSNSVSYFHAESDPVTISGLDKGIAHTYRWYVKYGGKTYYSDAGNVPAHFMTANQERPKNAKFTITKKAPIRRGHDSDSSVIATVSSGTYTIYGATTNVTGSLWYYINYNGQYGWIYDGNGTYSMDKLTVKHGNSDTPNACAVHTYCYGADPAPSWASKGLAVGSTVTVLEELNNSYGNVWYHVKSGSNDGWIWADYFRGDAITQLTSLSGTKEISIIQDKEMGLTFLTNEVTGHYFDVNKATSFTVPDGTPEINGLDQAQYMQTINIPASVKEIHMGVFSACFSLKTVNFAGTTAQWNAIVVHANNACLKNAVVNCLGDAPVTNGAAFTTVKATPYSTNAYLEATVTVQSGSGTFTGSGIRVWNSSGTLIASKDETHSYKRSASGTASYNIWYDITNELGATLTQNSSYTYQFYSVFNGATIWSSTHSFTTTGYSTTVTWENLNAYPTETSVQYTFKGTMSQKGKFYYWGYNVWDIAGNHIASKHYTKNEDSNLEKYTQASFFSIDKAFIYNLRPNTTYVFQGYLAFAPYGTSTPVYHYTDKLTFITKDTTAPSISNVQITNATANGYTVSCTVTDNDAVSRVQFPTWSDPEWQDDIVWHDGVQNGNTWSYTVNVNDGHKGDINCWYQTHIYAWDRKDNSNFTTVSTFVDATPPEISDVNIIGRTADSYTVSCKITDNSAVGVVGDTSYANYSLDAKWTEGSISGDTLTFTVKTGDHQGKTNCLYTSDILATDLQSNSTVYTVSLFMDGIAPVISDVRITNVSSKGYTVSCVVNDASGVAKVQFPTWNEPDGQNDLCMYEGTPNGDVWTCTISTPINHGGLLDCRYFTQIQATDHQGNVATLSEPESVYLEASHKQLSYTAAKEPTCSTEGCIDHWYCAGCGLYFDDNGNSIPENTISIPAVSNKHHVQDDVCIHCGQTFSRAGMSTFVLPDAIGSIRSEAFFGTSLQVVVIPAGCTFIGSDAFASCEQLQYAYIGSESTTIALDAFADSVQLIYPAQ